MEPPNLLPNAPDGRRGDLLVRDFNERDTLMDIAVTHPLKNRERSLRTPGWARTDMESRKRMKYEAYAQLADLKFLPVVWDAYGAAASGACHVIKTGVALLDNKQPEFEGPNWAAASPAAFYKQLLSVKLQKGSARIVRVVRSQWV